MASPPTLVNVSPPDNANIFWVLQVLDRDEQDNRKRHSAIIYSDGNVRWAPLTLTDRGRLQLKISDIGPEDSWLYRWVDAKSGPNRPPIPVQTGHPFRSNPAGHSGLN